MPKSATPRLSPLLNPHPYPSEHRQAWHDRVSVSFVHRAIFLAGVFNSCPQRQYANRLSWFYPEWLIDLFDVLGCESCFCIVNYHLR